MTIAVAPKLRKTSVREDVVTSLQVVPDHRGAPRPSNNELFAIPPAVIERVVSGESTLTVGKREHALPLRILIAGMPSTLLACVMLWTAQHAPGTDRIGVTIFAVIAGVPLAAAIWYRTRFVHRCTYVGEDGIAIFELRGQRDAQISSHVMLFADVAQLCATTTQHYLNGGYRNTTYDYRWIDLLGRRRVRLTGKYVGKDRPPKAGDAFHFASASEVAWSVHYLARAQGQLEEEGSIAFRVDDNRLVRVGPGFMEFHFDDDPVRVRREDIRAVTLGRGVFSFKHKDAKWYRSAGKYSFRYGEMANGKVFFLALDKLMGYRWT